MPDHDHILLSYSNHESNFALKLAVDLKNAGIKLWMDRLDIEPGADWRRSLQEGINTSVAVLAVLSEGSVQSQYCQRELARADRLGRPIIPILLTPIAKPDWPIEIERRQYVDFTQWQNDMIYQRQLTRLINYLRDRFKSHHHELPTPEARYLNSLIATLKDRNSLQTHLDPDVRPEPFSTFEWNLATDNTPRKQTGILIRRDTLAGRRTSLTNRILRNFAATGQLTLIGEPGTGKTSLLEYLCLKFAHERQRNPDTGLLPVLVRAEDWDDDTHFADFFEQSVPLQVDVSRAVVLIDGLDVIGTENDAKLAQIRDWIHESHRVIISCRSEWFRKQYHLQGMPTVTAYDLALRQVRVFLSSVFSAQRAARILDEYPGKYLQAVLCNPRLLNMLANINHNIPLENVGLALQSLLQKLIAREQPPGNDLSRAYPALEQALSRLAIEDEVTIPYAKAQQQVGSEALLLGLRTGLLLSNDSGVRFSYPIFRSYFTAVWMKQAGIAWQEIQGRSDFYQVLLCLAGITSAPDDLVISIYHEYPELAINCLVTDVSVTTVKRVLSYWLRIGQSLDLPMLTHVTRLPDALICMMKEETWTIRQIAHGILQVLPVPYLDGIIEMLSLREDERADAALAIRQIGTRALPTLIQHLEHPNAKLRQNVIWALDELGDRACVPGLVQALNDDDPALVTYAIQALGYLHDPDSFPALINMLGHNDADVRQTALDTLEWVRESATDALIDALDHPNPALRQQVVALLAENPASNVTEALLKATYDTSLNVRLDAITALSDRQTPETVERLQECLHEVQLRSAAQTALQHFRSAAGVPLGVASHDMPDAAPDNLPRNLPDDMPDDTPDPAVDKRDSATIARERIERLLAANPVHRARPDMQDQSGAADHDHHHHDRRNGTSDTKRGREDKPDIHTALHNEILDGLLEQLQNSEWGEREEAAKALREYARSLQGQAALHAVRKLEPLLQSDNWVLRWAVVEPLAWIGHSSSVPGFIVLLEDDNWMVRIAAIRGLQEINDPSACDAIERRLDDRNNLVREAALEALSHCGDTRLIPSIARTLDDSDEILRLAAVRALNQFHHKSTVRSLVKALNDIDKHVRWAAVDGLRTIADTSAVNALILRLDDNEKPHWEQERICDIAAATLERIGTARAIEAVTRWRQQQQ